MQPAKTFDELVSGADVEVVGIAKDDLSSEFVKLLWANRFDRALRAHGHKDRRFNRAPPGFEDPGTGFGGGVGGEEAKRCRAAHGVFQTV